MSQIEPGKKLGALIDEKDSEFFLNNIYLHYSSWYQAEHRGVTDFNFAYFYPMVVRYKPSRESFIDEGASWHAKWFDLRDAKRLVYRHSSGPGTRLHHLHARDSDLARPRAPFRATASEAPTAHAKPGYGFPRRQSVHGVRGTRWRCSVSGHGPGFLEHRGIRDESTAGHRSTSDHRLELPQLILAAHIPSSTSHG